VIIDKITMIIGSCDKRWLIQKIDDVDNQGRSQYYSLGMAKNDITRYNICFNLLYMSCKKNPA